MKRGKPANKELKGNRKENLNIIRGTQRIIDPEKGPANKQSVSLPDHNLNISKKQGRCSKKNTDLFRLNTFFYSHSMVEGGFEVISYTTLFIPFTSLTEIYTDELKHAAKWNYLFTLNYEDEEETAVPVLPPKDTVLQDKQKGTKA